MVAEKKRLEEIDIIKALGIICMVAGHSGAPFSQFVRLFHMSVFFIASGYVFCADAADSLQGLKNGILSKLKHLWLPFVIWTSIYALSHNALMQIHVYTSNPGLLEYVTEAQTELSVPYTWTEIGSKILKSTLLSCQEELFGAAWFLKILLLISVGYLITEYLAKKKVPNHVRLVQGLLSAILLAGGHLCYIKGVENMDLELAAAYYCLYCMGHALALNRKLYVKWNGKIFLPALVSSCGLLIWMSNMEINSRSDPVTLPATAILGWIFLYSLAYFVKFVPWLKKIMLFIGRRTLSVVVLHFLCMKLVAAAVAAYYDVPGFCIAAFPNLYGNRGCWWLAYTVVGVGVPVVLDELYRTVKGRFLKSKVYNGGKQ